MNKHLANLINELKMNNVVMYLLKKDIFRLSSYLYGYAHAYKDLNKGEMDMYNTLEQFTKWIAIKKRYENIALSWDNILFLACYGDESKAVDHFFYEWDLFCEEIGED